MRWDDLFGDLEGQWEAEQRRELDAEVADRTRRERAAIGLHERFAGARGLEVAIGLRNRSAVVGRVSDVGDGWVLVGEGHSVALVPFHGITSVVGQGVRADGGGIGRRFGLGYALRGLSRDRAVVAVTDASGTRVTGTIDAVGQDVLELSEHPADLPRRPENVTARRLVPFDALVVVQPA